MIVKRPLRPERLRKPPAGFNWLDHRLVRDRYIDKCSHQAAALYLFLVTAADAQGLSYYSEAALMMRLSMDGHTLSQARRNLLEVGLIAYEKPLYQVLSLDDTPPSAAKTIDTTLPSGSDSKALPEEGIKSIKEILKLIEEDIP